MKRIISILSVLGFVLACGAPTDQELVADPELGTLEQPEYVSGEYGIDPNYNRCTLSDPYCWGPIRKNRKWKFYAGTCSTWWQTRVVELWYEFLDLDYLGWTLEEGTSSNADIKIYCGECPYSGYEDAFGCAPYSSTPAETTILPSGLEWREADKFQIYIDVDEIESIPGWSTASEAGRQKFGRTILRHEFGHAYGFGHNPNYSSSGISVMSLVANFTTEYFFNVPERTWMGCYNPSNWNIPDWPCGDY